jgi:trigger factor
MINSKTFEGNEGKGIQLVLGRDLFIKGFDNQLLGSKKNEVKSVDVKLPENYPKKELANKKANFNCKIINIKKPIETKIDNDFAKKLGAKDINDLKNLIKKQITSEYQNNLNVITKKDVLKQLESSYSVDLPQNLIEQETKIITQNLKKEDIEKYKDKNIKLAKSRIKIGLILNEIGEKNNLKINEDEIRNEIKKHIKNMPGQEDMVMKHYQKNPSAVASLRGVLYEDKIIELIKSKITLTKKSINLKEAEEILKNFTHTEESLKTNKPKKKQQKLKTIKKK